MRKNSQNTQYQGEKSCLFFEMKELEAEERQANEPILKNIQETLPIINQSNEIDLEADHFPDLMKIQKNDVKMQQGQLVAQNSQITPSKEGEKTKQNIIQSNFQAEHLTRLDQSLLHKTIDEIEIQEQEIRMNENKPVNPNPQLQNIKVQALNQLSRPEKLRKIAAIFVSCGPKGDIIEHFGKKYKISHFGMFYSLYQIFVEVISQVSKLLAQLGSLTGKPICLHYKDVHPMLYCRLWMTEAQLNCFLQLVGTVFTDNRFPMIKSSLIDIYEAIRQKINTGWRKPGMYIHPKRQKPEKDTAFEKRTAIFQKMVNVSVDNPTKKIAYQREVGVLFSDNKCSSDIVKNMMQRCPSPDWTEKSVNKILGDLMNEGIKKLLKATSLVSSKLKNFPLLAANQQQIRNLVKTDPNQRIKRSLVSLAITRWRKDLKIVNTIDTINDQIRKRDIQ